LPFFSFYEALSRLQERFAPVSFLSADKLETLPPSHPQFPEKVRKNTIPWDGVF